MSDQVAAERCPCASGDVFAECCAPILEGKLAPTAEKLMRSRFTAFCRGDEAHLLRTWHATTRPVDLDLDADTQWLRLQILDTRAGGPFDNEGEVEFVAIYSEDGQKRRMQERSRFVREEREWFYLDGIHSA